MRFAAMLLLLIPQPCPAARGTIECTVVTTATMSDSGVVSGPRPAQTTVVKNPDGSLTIRADY